MTPVKVIITRHIHYHLVNVVKASKLLTVFQNQVCALFSPFSRSIGSF